MFKFVILLLVLFIQGCTSTRYTPQGYKTETFMLYGLFPIHAMHTPFMYCENAYFKSDEFLLDLNKSKLFNKTALEIDGFSTEGPRFNDAENPLTCVSIVKFDDGSTQKGKMSITMVEEMVFKYKWLSEDEENRRKTEEEKKAEKIVKDFYSKYPLSDYPYLALFSCSVSQAKVDLTECLVGQGGYASIEVKNGYEYIFHQGGNYSWGMEDSRKVVSLPLSKKFAIRMQNASNGSTLGMIVMDRKNNKFVFQKQVSEFGVIEVEN